MIMVFVLLLLVFVFLVVLIVFVARVHEPLRNLPGRQVATIGTTRRCRARSSGTVVSCDRGISLHLSGRKMTVSSRHIRHVSRNARRLTLGLIAESNERQQTTSRGLVCAWNRFDQSTDAREVRQYPPIASDAHLSRNKNDLGLCYSDDGNTIKSFSFHPSFHPTSSCCC